MNDNMFNELLESVKEMDQIAKGKKKASRRFTFKDPEVKDIREKTGLSQNPLCAINRCEQTHFRELGTRKTTSDRSCPRVIKDR